jgi:hypothetical protein
LLPSSSATAVRIKSPVAENSIAAAVRDNKSPTANLRNQLRPCVVETPGSCKSIKLRQCVMWIPSSLSSQNYGRVWL